MFSLGSVLKRSKWAVMACAAAVSSTYLHTSTAHAEAQPKEKETLGVFLVPESRAILANHLEKTLGIKSSGDVKADDQQALGREVILKAELSDVDSYIYRPLFGERAAFRLKGLITTEEGDVVGFGRVTNMTGEVMDEEYEASILLKTKAPASEAGREKREKLIDLPTIVYQTTPKATIGDKWTGSVPAGQVLSRQYSALPGVTVRNLPREEQIVLDGRVCSSLFADPVTGMCSFDRSSISDEEIAPDALTGGGEEERKVSTATHANLADLQQRRSMQQSQEEAPAVTAAELEEKCPVCRYMKGGPCREQFVEWDTCINGLKEDEDIKMCYEATAQMMACMQQYEYYDPMTSNSRK